MAKDKVKAPKPEGKKSLSKVKNGAVTKPAEAPKVKSKELAKKVAKKEEEKKLTKKKKAPTPSSESDSSGSDSDQKMGDAGSSSDSSSESEEEGKGVKVPTKKAADAKPAKKAADAKPAKKTADAKPAKKAEPEPSGSESDSSESSESSEDEKAPVKNGAKPKVAEKAKPAESESSDSESDSEKSNSEDKKAKPEAAKATAKATEDDDSSSESESDSEEKPASKPASKPEKAVKAEPAESDDSGSSDESSGSDESSDESEESEDETAKPPKRKADAAEEVPVKKTKTEEAGNAASANLFVGNLSWNIDEEWLRSEFEGFGELSGVRVVTDRETGRSRGFGYVEFADAGNAAKAHTAKKGVEIDGRAINVDFANARPANNAGGPVDKALGRAKSFGDQTSPESDTLFVGNISFGADEKMVHDLFANHGTITGVRLPTDQESGRPKGFGYVQFSSVDEARSAFGDMQGGELAGRPVRLDYSSPRQNAGGSPGGGRGGRGGGGRGDGRGRGRGDGGGRGRGDRGGRGGDRGRGGGRGGFGDFSGKKTTF